MKTEITLANPCGNADAAMLMCRYIDERKSEILAEFDALEITADNYASPEVKAKIYELEGAVEDLRKRGKSLVEAVVAESEAKRVLTQIDSRLWSFKSNADPNCVYAILSSALKDVKKKVDCFKSANEPPKPTHTYLVRMTCTDKALGKILEAAKKEGASEFVWCVPQSDKAVKAAQKLFEENV